MKKGNLLLLFLSLSACKIYAQNFISSAIRQSSGISKQYSAIPDNEAVKFNPSQAKSLLNLNQLSDLVLTATEQDKLGFIHYRFYQTFKGIPVMNSMYIVHTKNGLLKSLGGEIVTDFTATQSVTAPKIQTAQAIAAAVKYVNAQTYAWQDAGMEKSIKMQTKNPKASYAPKASLVWYSPTDDVSPADMRLCFKIDVYARQPLSRAYYFIDAFTGNVLGKQDILCFSDATGTAATAYSGSVTIHSDLNAGSYRLRDLTKGNGIITVHGETGQRGNDYSNNSANWALQGADQAALDAHYGVSQTYAFYNTVFNRNSYDDKGTALYSYVNDPTYTDNAFWDGSAMNFNKRSDNTQYPGGTTGIDVTGHELTHGVTQETSALVYKNESGAINESMSDIFGKSVQFWSKPNDVNWVLSNDMDWEIRDMGNPNNDKQPDTYKGKYYLSGGLAYILDNGGVHTNSGVGNYMFYLLVTGGSGTNDIGNSYSVSGIGLTKADAILYRTNTVYLVPSSKYADWRTACINAATDLYGANSNEVREVKNAWYAVGIGESGGTGIAYCTSAGLSTANEYISKITFGSINNTSGDNGGYADFTSQSTTVTAGQSYTIKAQAGFTGSTRKEAWTLYIDYNGDGDFEDAGERVGSQVITSNKLLGKSFTIPATAKNGTTRMRIQMHSNTIITDPCATFNNGEVEDYSIKISGGSNFAQPASGESQSLISNISVLPNPVASSVLRVNYTLVNKGNISFRLSDAAGQSSYAYKAGLQNKGANNYTITNIASLHNGYYYLSIEQDNKIIGKITVLVSH